MIICEHEQGSEGWLKSRLGVATASKFDCILTPTGKPTTASKSETYMNQLIAEWLIGEPVDQMEPTKWMQRGTELEPEARETYTFTTGKEVEQAGLCYLNDKKQIGASVDGMVGDDGLIEIKCPKASTMVGYIIKGGLPLGYKPQVQGQLMVMDREWCDFYVYHPQMEPYLYRVMRDDRYIKILSEALDEFVDEMLEKRETLKGE